MESLFVPLGFKVPTGIYQACWDCAKEIDPGFRKPLEIPYPPPSNPHRLTDNMNYCLFYCGICKNYCREDEQPESIRIHPADVSGLGHLDLFDDPGEAIDNLKPGCYLACSECRAKYRPLIVARLKRQCCRCGGQLNEDKWCSKCRDVMRPILEASADPLTVDGNFLL